MRASGKKPTHNQRQFLKSIGLQPANWLIIKDTPELMEIVYRYTEKKRVIEKGRFFIC